MGARAAGARTAASGLAAVLFCGAAVAACTCGQLGATDGGGGTGTDAGAGSGADAGSGPGSDAAGPPQLVSVYAHSADTLYRVDPDTLTVTAVGPFLWPNGSDQMTDIAIDHTGYMVGISFTDVYAVDPVTAACTYLAPLDTLFNGLSFVPAEQFEPTGNEVLMGAALDGSLYLLDPVTGASTPVGNYGGGWGSSGDLVSVVGLGTLATLTDDPLGIGGATDQLAWVDPMTGTATIIGNTGFTDIWGLGYWEDRAFGFTTAGQFVTLNVDTGAATVVDSSGVEWWGAAVTTTAPVIQ